MIDHPVSDVGPAEDQRGDKHRLHVVLVRHSKLVLGEKVKECVYFLVNALL